MKKYQYKARTRQGRSVTGVLEVDSREEVLRRLRQQEYLVTAIKEVPQSTFAALLAPKGVLKAKNLAIICRQFAIQLSAGMSLVASLDLMHQQSEDPRVKRAMYQIRTDLSSGLSLTRSLAKQTHVFPHVFIHLMEAGEAAGALPEVLERLALYYEREDELRKKVSEALMYPGIVVSVAGLMVLALLFFVLPMLIKNFMAFGVQPPALTQAVLAGRDWLMANFLWVALGLTGLVYGMRRLLRTVAGRRFKDSLALRLPVVGNLMKMIIFSRFCRTLGLMLHSGVSMIDSLQIVERLMENVVVKSNLHDARLGVQRGQGLSEPLASRSIFPVMLVQMVAVGEQTGNLEKTLVQMADFYDREVNFSVSSFTKLLEPAIMLVLGVVVLFILISVYLPMMQMVTQL